MDAILSMLGLAQKAGRIASGEFATEKAVRSGRANLILLTEDASANTQKKITDMAAYYELPLIIYGNKADVGRSIGKGERSMLAVLDAGFAASLEKKWKAFRTLQAEERSDTGR